MGIVEPTRGKGMGRDGVSLGEVVFGSWSVMLVYFSYPLGTPMCMRDGLFCTGDVGVIHSDGDLEIKDGSKHGIICVVESIRSVENISSVEIESVLYTHPAVNWTDMVPRPDEFWSESPCAFVSLKHGLSNGPGEKDIIDYCREKMANFQRLAADGINWEDLFQQGHSVYIEISLLFLLMGGAFLTVLNG